MSVEHFFQLYPYGTKMDVALTWSAVSPTTARIQEKDVEDRLLKDTGAQAMRALPCPQQG